MAIATPATHQDRRWFMGIEHLKGHARPRARRRGDPPSRCGPGGGIPNPPRRHCRPVQLKSNRGRIRVRTYACPWTGLRAPEKAAQPNAPRGRPGSPPRGPRNTTGPRRRPGSSSGYWFWNWVKQKKSPVGFRSTCTCTCMALLCCSCPWRPVLSARHIF